MCSFFVVLSQLSHTAMFTKMCPVNDTGKISITPAFLQINYWKLISLRAQLMQSSFCRWRTRGLNLLCLQLLVSSEPQHRLNQQHSCLALFYGSGSVLRNSTLALISVVHLFSISKIILASRLGKMLNLRTRNRLVNNNTDFISASLKLIVYETFQTLTTNHTINYVIMILISSES